MATLADHWLLKMEQKVQLWLVQGMGMKTPLMLQRFNMLLQHLKLLLRNLKLLLRHLNLLLRHLSEMDEYILQSSLKSEEKG